MSSLIANKVTTNMCLALVKLYIVRIIVCATVQTYITYTIIITTITIRMPHLYVILLPKLFIILPTTLHLFVRSSQPQLHTRLTELLLIAVCFVLSFYMRTLSVKVKGLWSRLLENAMATTCVCAFSYLSVPFVYCCWFIWKVFKVCYHCLLLRLLSVCLHYYTLSYCFLC